MDRKEGIQFATRTCHDHRGLMREAIHYVLSAKFEPPMGVRSEDVGAIFTYIRLNVFYYVGDQKMAFTLKRTDRYVFYFRPAPYDGLHAGHLDFTVVPLQQLATRVHEDTADMTVFGSVMRTETRQDVAWSSHAALAAEKTAGFWHDAREEFIRKTWAPGRHADWCLAHDERIDIGLA